MPFQPASSPILRTEEKAWSLGHFKVEDIDETDSADIVTQAYVEKYSVVITPNAYMKIYGKNAVLIVEYIIKTDPGTGTVDVQTLVDAGDAVEKTGLTIASGKQTAIHTEIGAAALAAGTSYTVSLEAKNSDAGQTSVIDYCKIYLHIGANHATGKELWKFNDIQSLRFDFRELQYAVWTGATDTATLSIRVDAISHDILEEGSTMKTSREEIPAEMSVGAVNSDIKIFGSTDNADNPFVLKVLVYTRAWLE